MGNLPAFVELREEGPREGFQMEKKSKAPAKKKSGKQTKTQWKPKRKKSASKGNQGRSKQKPANNKRRSMRA